MLRTAELDYDLPQDRIAVRPADPRDSARLMVLSRSDASRLEHRTVRELPELLAPGDLLVVNRSRVLPARFGGVREDTGGRVDGLYLHDGPCAGTWVCLLRARRFREGARVRVEHMAKGPKCQRANEEEREEKSESGIVLVLLERAPEPAGAWIVKVEDERPHPGPLPRGAGEGGLSAPEVLERIGVAPLPPYILAARRAAGLATDVPEDREWYQTVYAEQGHTAEEPIGKSAKSKSGHGTWEGSATGLADSATSPARSVGQSGAGEGGEGNEDAEAATERRGTRGSVAAPTAGLHFTEGLLRSVEARGVRVAGVTLHVGAGTFRPVETEFVEEHRMHAEWCSMTPETVELVERTRREGGRVFAVGTTAGRTLESYAAEIERSGRVPDALETRLLITPGYRWLWVDGMVTNFHLPRSTLMAMVGALLRDDGVARLKRAYVEAVESGYRFYSYGDAMMVGP